MSSESIVIFGAGGRAGAAITTEALRRRLPVIAVVRDPAGHPELTAHGDAVTVVSGDLTDADSSAAVVAAVDRPVAAIVNAVTPFSQPPPTFDGFDPDYFVHLVGNLARAAGRGRVLDIGLVATLRVVSPASPQGGGRLYDDADVFPAFLRPFAEAKLRGVEEWQRHDADWLVLTPPLALAPDAPVTGAYRIGTDLLDLESAQTPLSYADLALAVLDQVERPTLDHEQVTVYGVDAR